MNELAIYIPSEANLTLADPTLLDYYHDRENRIYWLDGEVTSAAFDLVQTIIRINREDKDKPIEERVPLRIIIDSPGGDLDVEETIVSMIELSETPIWGIALGTVASAASLIYISCHKRFALPNTTFVFHKGSASGISGNYNEINAMMKDYEYKVEKLVTSYIKYTTYPEEVIREKIENDWYIHTEEALEYGVCEHLIEDIGVFFE